MIIIRIQIVFYVVLHVFAIISFYHYLLIFRCIYCPEGFNPHACMKSIMGSLFFGIEYLHFFLGIRRCNGKIILVKANLK